MTLRRKRPADQTGDRSEVARLIVSDESARRARTRFRPLVADPYQLPEFPKDVKPSSALAMDEAFDTSSALAWASQAYATSAFADGVAFLGYPTLAAMAQRPEYRKMVETLATEMTRRFIRVTAKGSGDKSERIDAINADLKRFKIRDLFRRATEIDGFFGRSHIFIDLGTDDPEEMKTPIGTGRDAVSKGKIAKGSLRGFRIIEPVWCYPGEYDTSNPLSPNWYRPAQWLVQGKSAHRSRLLTIVSREVPDLLKPAYAFGGLSLTQMAKPYVENWIRTRQSVSDLVAKFSKRGFKMPLSEALAAGAGDNLFNRVDLFNALSDNFGAMILNTDEEYFEVSTPLGSLDKLQAQSQEQMACVPGIPLVKLLGVTPAGLNASADGEIRVFYDAIGAKQEDDLRDPLTTVIDIIQLNRFGDVDEDIDFVFEPLWQMSDKEKAEVATATATAVSAIEGSGIIDVPTALKELRRASEVTGLFSMITDRMIEEAEAELPGMPGALLTDDPDRLSDDVSPAGRKNLSDLLAAAQ